jgi:hypothetical protein
MGRLRDLLSRLVKYKPAADLPSPICTHRNLPERQQHTKLIANAVDYCHSHKEKMCLVCSDVHEQQHCVLDRTPHNTQSGSTRTSATAPSATSTLAT